MYVYYTKVCLGSDSSVETPFKSFWHITKVSCQCVEDPETRLDHDSSAHLLAPLTSLGMVPRVAVTYRP